VDRRAFIAGTAGLAAAVGLPGLRTTLAAPPSTLAIERRTLDVKGRAASVFGIRRPDGTHGLALGPGEPFRVDLANRIDEATIIHWHGQKAPYLQDGVADRNVPLIEASGTRRYDFVPTPGTHWMHAHHSLHEQALMAAPLVVHSAEDARADAQDVTVLLHDFSFRDPAEILAELTGGASGGHDMHAMDGSDAMAGMDTGAEGSAGHDMSAMAMPMDLNDVAYDAFLANDRTLDDPFVVVVERHGRVRLRLINGAASSAFWIDLGALQGTLIAVDGNPVAPVAGARFPMATAQRLDIAIDVPSGAAFPVFAQLEGSRQRTGFVLAAPGAAVGRYADLADMDAPPVDLTLETRLRATLPLAERPADLAFALVLGGTMAPYAWSIDGRLWPDAERPVIRQGQRVVIAMVNHSMMAHPMHLHGHHFQVVEINGAPFAGAVRDTVLVPAMGSVAVAFDADNPGRWPLHCHNLYHMATGMMTEVVYDAFA
jgi:FtsP/CotA-like multicopper oxidase with cupredoxin domain